MFKVTKQLQPPAIIHMFKSTSEISPRVTRRRAKGNHCPPLARLEMTGKGFSHTGYKTWETVPDYIKNSKDLNEFKGLINQI